MSGSPLAEDDMNNNLLFQRLSGDKSTLPFERDTCHEVFMKEWNLKII